MIYINDIIHETLNLISTLKANIVHLEEQH